MNNLIRKPFKYQQFNVVYWLIGINLLVFLFTSIFGSSFNIILEINNEKVSVPISRALAMIPLTVRHGWIWSFVTYMFMHGGFAHIFFNMFGLFMFGVHVERQMGSLEFLLYYMMTGILAGIFSFFVFFLTGNFFVALVGASGAIFAVQLAYAVLFPTTVINIWGLIPIRAPLMVLGFTVLSLFFVVTGGGGNVAHLTHLAGFGFGWIYFLIRFGVDPWRRLTGRNP
ncbi:MAG: rhomboid family intramembrane serine protease [Treponema sp.]|nr:rhomboid family intramembrane serine protease [Treponema sp.]MCL2250529.1 rhomboid family intramembrane serine protease [Treponema sp.]